tara:strand:+ start:253 stop:999 length:747 start_codon:yes stop_codon:yes gene_type:complete
LSVFVRRRAVKAGRPRDRLTADALRVQAGREADRGFVLNAKESLVTALSAQGVGGSSPDPIRIVLGEGEWTIPVAGIVIQRSDIHFIGSPRGGTRFVRTKATTRNMLLCTGARITLENIWFDDQLGGDSCLELRGDDSAVKNCWFESCFRAIEFNGGDRATIDGNEIKSHTDTNYGIFLTGTSDRNRVTNNRIHTGAGAANFIYAGDSVTDSLFIGNIWRTAGRSISYKGSSGNIGSATNNIGTVLAR